MKKLKNNIQYAQYIISVHYQYIHIKHTKTYFETKHMIKNAFAIIIYDLLWTNGVKEVYIYKTLFPEGVIQNVVSCQQ